MMHPDFWLGWMWSPILLLVIYMVLWAIGLLHLTA